MSEVKDKYIKRLDDYLKSVGHSQMSRELMTILDKYVETANKRKIK